MSIAPKYVSDFDCSEGCCKYPEFRCTGHCRFQENRERELTNQIIESLRAQIISLEKQVSPELMDSYQSMQEQLAAAKIPEGWTIRKINDVIIKVTSPTQYSWSFIKGDPEDGKSNMGAFIFDYFNSLLSATSQPPENEK